MPSLQILKNVVKNPIFLDAVTGTLGGGLGYAASELENKHLYENEGVKNISTLVGTGTGALALPLIRRKNSIGLKLLGSYLGLKQLGLLAVDKSTGYFDAVKKREEDEKEIRNLTLDTAKATSETAKNLEGSTKYLADTLKSAFPAIGGLGAALLTLYAINTFKKNDKQKQNITVKLDDKNKNKNFYLEIPSEKISDKFYNTLGREILFKSKEEKEAAEKALANQNLNKAASSIESDNIKITFPKQREALNKYFYAKHGDIDTLKEIEKRYPDLSEEQHLAILDKLQKQNETLLPKLIAAAGTMLVNKAGLNTFDPKKYTVSPVHKEWKFPGEAKGKEEE